jgi:NitT/TauT family transport system substrate-binding protein
MMRFGSIAALVAAAVLALGGCRDDDTTRGVTTIRVGALPITDLVQLYVADAKGFFREEGLQVQIRNLEGGAAIIPAVQGGSLDLGWSNSISLLQARARGLPVRFFAGGFYQRQGHWTSALMVPRTSPIRRPAQLRGKRVAINTLANINELVMRAYLDRAGVGGEAAKLLEVPFPEQPAALKSGRVDAILANEPFVTLAKQGGARTLEPNPFAEIGSSAFVAAFFATDEWLREHAEAAAAFRRAVAKATEYWNAHPEERAGFVARYTKVPRKVAARIELGEPRTEISARDVQREIELSRRYGLLPRALDAGEVLAR